MQRRFSHQCGQHRARERSPGLPFALTPTAPRAREGICPDSAHVSHAAQDLMCGRLEERYGRGAVREIPLHPLPAQGRAPDPDCGAELPRN
jgi:hypothetical protein